MEENRGTRAISSRLSNFGCRVTRVQAGGERRGRGRGGINLLLSSSPGFRNPNPGCSSPGRRMGGWLYGSQRDSIKFRRQEVFALSPGKIGDSGLYLRRRELYAAERKATWNFSSDSYRRGAEPVFSRTKGGPGSARPSPAESSIFSNVRG